jgi:hypothetical protein
VYRERWRILGIGAPPESSGQVLFGCLANEGPEQ